MRIKNIKNIKLFAHGKRGLIYVGKLGRRKVAIKTKHPKSKAVGRIQNEISFLQKFNKYKIGPKLIKHTNKYFVYQFAQGVFIKQFLEKENSLPKIKKILKNIFEQCFVMDKLGINKEEMHNPYKHVVVGRKITLLDFERCSITKKPHNVTQFIQYVLRNGKLLEQKGFKIDRDELIGLGKIYKKRINKKNFKKILDNIH